MDYYVQSFLPHRLQWLKINRDKDGRIIPNYIDPEVMVELPAGSDDKNVIKITQEQYDFLNADVQFKSLLKINKGGVRFIDRMPSRMIDDKEKLASALSENAQLKAELAKLKSVRK